MWRAHLIRVDVVLVLACEVARHRDGDGVRDDRYEDRVRHQTRPQREVRQLGLRHPVQSSTERAVSFEYSNSNRIESNRPMNSHTSSTQWSGIACIRQRIDIPGWDRAHCDHAVIAGPHVDAVLQVEHMAQHQTDDDLRANASTTTLLNKEQVYDTYCTGTSLYSRVNSYTLQCTRRIRWNE